MITGFNNQKLNTGFCILMQVWSSIGHKKLMNHTVAIKSLKKIALHRFENIKMSLLMCIHQMQKVQTSYLGGLILSCLKKIHV